MSRGIAAPVISVSNKTRFKSKCFQHDYWNK